MDVRVGLWRRLSTEELMLLNCGVGEDSFESHLDCKEIQSVHPNGNQSWIFFGRTDAETETPILWLPDVKNWLIGKYPDAGKDWRWEEKGTTEDEMVGWHHRLNGHELEQALGVGDGQGSLVCCSPWGCKESDMTEWLNWTELNIIIYLSKSIEQTALRVSPDVNYQLYVVRMCWCMFLVGKVSHYLFVFCIFQVPLQSYW